MENMDDGEIEVSEHHVFHPNSDSSSNAQASISADSFLDDILRNAQTCTHTHTCNPPGPDAAHTHTCYHTHTHLIPSEKDGFPHVEKSSKQQRPSGNREAVRKYREKKKAHTAYLEEEVKKLRSVNQQLMRKLQRQAHLEAEVSRLQALLFDLKGKIDCELGDFPFQKQCSNANTLKGGGCQVSPMNDLACGIAGSVPSSGIDGLGDAMPYWETNCLPATAKRLQDSLDSFVSSMPQE